MSILGSQVFALHRGHKSIIPSPRRFRGTDTTHILPRALYTTTQEDVLSSCKSSSPRRERYFNDVPRRSKRPWLKRRTARTIQCTMLESKRLSKDSTGELYQPLARLRLMLRNSIFTSPGHRVALRLPAPGGGCINGNCSPIWSTKVPCHNSIYLQTLMT